MTKKQKDYIEKQLNIIQDKETVEALMKYASSMHSSHTPPYTKDTLLRAVDVRMDELTRPLPMAVNGDLDDID